MVKPEEYFYLEGGGIIKTPRELALKLDTISQEVFERHVGPGFNHFANWIEGVFKDKELADSLRQLSDRKDMQILLLKHALKQIKGKPRRHICGVCGKPFDSKVGLSVHKSVAHGGAKNGQ